jgi:hypothetical protein
VPHSQLQWKNERGRAVVIWIEPWAEDYTLLPGDRFELRADCPKDTPWFGLDQSEEQLTIWVNGDAAVIQPLVVNGVPAECGYNRGRK